MKLDIEYKLEELKRDIQTHKSPEELIKKVDSIEAIRHVCLSADYCP
ncbi:MAG: hypothetical protein WC649_06245 [Desulfobacteria bacterium]